MVLVPGLSNLEYTIHQNESHEQSTINTISQPLSVNDIVNLSQLSNTPLGPINNQSQVLQTNLSSIGDATTRNQIAHNGLVCLYHHNETNNVIEHYCRPVSESFRAPHKICNFKKNCIILKSKVFSKGQQNRNKSPTVFGSIPWMSKKKQL